MSIEEQPSSQNKTTSQSSWLKKIILTLFILGIIAAGIAAWILYPVYLERKENINETFRGKLIEIPDTIGTLQALSSFLFEKGIIAEQESFLALAQKNNLPVAIGTYRLDKTAKSNRDLQRALRADKRIAQLVFHNIRTKEQLAGVLSQRVEADSLAFINLFNDSIYLQSLGFQPHTIIAAFIPNTYEVYWNTAPEAIIERMIKEYHKFWNEQRLEKAKALEMTPIQISTLASIVETESQYAPERPRIAGVYLNRLKKNWLLQADPTVVFAVGDFTITRVLNKHLATESPYNTYKNEGLPPGPIYMPSTNAIDAVLNYETHEYMFFCAKPDFSGQHAFAKTLSAHNTNAKVYHQWLNSIKKNKAN